MVVAAASGIIIGTLLSIIFRWEIFASPLWMIVSLIFLIFSFVKPNKITIIFAIIAGTILVSFRASVDLAGAEMLGGLVNKNMEITGTVSEDPDVDGGTVSLKLKDIVASDVEMKGKIFVQVNTSEKTERSDIVTVKGKITEGFGNYSGAMYRPELIKITHPEPGDVFLHARNWFSARVKKYLPEEESQLALAYTAGMKSELKNEVVDVLRIVGLTHIVVASGTHLSIITEFVRKIFGRLSKFASIFFSILFVLLFGGVIGWTASITRAAIVTIISLLTASVGRKMEAWRIILISMAITLMISPMYIMDLGWQLSFGSFIGILLVSPIITKWLYGEKKPNKVVEIMIATVSAQLLLIPIILYHFGAISIISIIANLLILPTIPAVMVLTFSLGILSFPVVGEILGALIKIIIDYHLLIVNFLAEQKMFLIEIKSENPAVFLLYILILVPVGYIIFLQERKRRAENSWL